MRRTVFVLALIVLLTTLLMMMLGPVLTACTSPPEVTMGYVIWQTPVHAGHGPYDVAVPAAYVQPESGMTFEMSDFAYKTDSRLTGIEAEWLSSYKLLITVPSGAATEIVFSDPVYAWTAADDSIETAEYQATVDGEEQVVPAWKDFQTKLDSTDGSLDGMVALGAAGYDRALRPAMYFSLATGESTTMERTFADGLPIAELLQNVTLTSAGTGVTYRFDFEYGFPENWRETGNYDLQRCTVTYTESPQE